MMCAPAWSLKLAAVNSVPWTNAGTGGAVEPPKAGVGSGRQSRDGSIEGLRAIALTLIFLTHFFVSFWSYVPQKSIPPQILATLVDLHLGSSTFILISSFFVYRKFVTRNDAAWLPFLKHRLLRIMPLYWLILAVYVALALNGAKSIQIPEHGGKGWSIFMNAFLISPMFGDLPINCPTWTLTCILLGYLTIPLIAKVQRLKPLALIRISLILAHAAVCWLLGFVGHRYLTISSFLAIGVLVYEANERSEFRELIARLRGGGAFLIVGVGFTIWIVLGHTVRALVLRTLLQTMVLQVSVAMFAAYCLTSKCRFHRFLLSRGPATLARYNYSYSLLSKLADS